MSIARNLVVTNPACMRSAKVEAIMFGQTKSKPAATNDAEFQRRLDQLLKETPIPVFWLFGKTQSGKSSIVKFLTGADQAEIGLGFKPCTRFARQYQFPTPEAPLLSFLDTRGLEEPGYDPAEEIEQFQQRAHVMIVTVRVLDHGVGGLIEQLRAIRRRNPDRPVVLALTCLHEAYPQQQHQQPYPFRTTEPTDGKAIAQSENLQRSIDAQAERFQGLYDFLVPLDLTPPDEGFDDPQYGGEHFKETLLRALPEAYRQTLLTLEAATHSLQDYFSRQALPHIVGFSSLAATAGAIPVPWVDMLILPGIQTQMIYHLARLYGQPLSGQRFLELASTLGMGMMVRQAIRELMKFIPFVGSFAGAALAGSATFALGKAFCYYYSAVHKGHVPRADELKKYYHEQLTLAETLWTKKKTP
jgi:uncharacterized protein (DUF697 family)/predicted GTPase